MNPVTPLNFLIAVVMVTYAIYLLPRCRKETRGMIVVYGIAGIWSFLVHIAVVIDLLMVDFMPWQFVTNYLIRPLLFVLQATVLAAMIKSGWRYDH
jgi:uncharacterized membrane protein (DUF4010 family)